jgi:hypothetical protein
MIHILQRGYRIFLAYFLFFFGLLTAVRFLLGKELNVFFTLISGIAIFMYTIGAMLGSEQVEEKNRGYTILATLPISNFEITAAKFLLPLVSGFALALSLILLFATFSAPAQDMLLVRSYFLLAASAGLLVAGLLYIGIFTFGYTKFVIVVLSFTTALGLVPMLILKRNREDMDVIIENLLAWIRGLDWLVLIPLLLVAYLGLMVLALKIRAWRDV